jgi:hypothetical protein
MNCVLILLLIDCCTIIVVVALKPIYLSVKVRKVEPDLLQDTVRLELGFHQDASRQTSCRGACGPLFVVISPLYPLLLEEKLGIKPQLVLNPQARVDATGKATHCIGILGLFLVVGPALLIVCAYSLHFPYPWCLFLSLLSIVRVALFFCSCLLLIVSIRSVMLPWGPSSLLVGKLWKQWSCRCLFILAFLLFFGA